MVNVHDEGSDCGCGSEGSFRVRAAWAKDFPGGLVARLLGADLYSGDEDRGGPKFSSVKNSGDCLSKTGECITGGKDISTFLDSLMASFSFKRNLSNLSLISFSKWENVDEDTTSVKSTSQKVKSQAKGKWAKYLHRLRRSFVTVDS